MKRPQLAIRCRRPASARFDKFGPLCGSGHNEGAIDIQAYVRCVLLSAISIGSDSLKLFTGNFQEPATVAILDLLLCGRKPENRAFLVAVQR